MAKTLIVDDSLTAPAIFLQMFVRAGHVVTVTGDGASGLSVARAQRPELALKALILVLAANSAPER